MIIHIDMDAFYASVEERDNPSLKGQPVVVAGNANERGVVSAANYAAREYGIHSAMPTATAIRLCRDLIILPVRMKYYVEVSAAIRDIFHRYTPLVEPLSLDEAFLDPAGGECLYGSAEATAWRIKADIKTELDLIASAGIAPNKFLAKLASDYDKPDGFTVVQPDEVIVFLDSLPLKRLWGVGASSLQRLNRMGIFTMRELRDTSVEVLQAQFGRHGAHLHQLSRGEDDRRVCPEHQAKSISHETTFSRDVVDWNDLEAVLMQLTEAVCTRLRRANLKGRTVTLKLRNPAFETHTASHTIAQGSNNTAQLWKAIKQLFWAQKQVHSPVRLIGVGVSNFDEPGAGQVDLFTGSNDERSDQLDQLADRAQDRFGANALRRASGLKRKTDKKP